MQTVNELWRHGLGDLSTRIRNKHETCQSHSRQAVDLAREIGTLLIEAKSSAGHGRWESWLETECGINPRTAQVYMQIAKYWDVIEAAAKTYGCALSTLTDARHLLKRQARRYERSTVERIQPARTLGEGPDANWPAKDMPVGESEPTPDEPRALAPPLEVDGLPVNRWIPPTDVRPHQVIFKRKVRELREWGRSVLDEIIGSDEPGTKFLAEGERSNFQSALDTLESVVTTRMPQHICPRCKGKRCEVCRRSGLVPKNLYRALNRCRME